MGHSLLLSPHNKVNESELLALHAHIKLSFGYLYLDQFI